MIPDDVVVEELKRLGNYPEGAALCQVLLKELQALTAIGAPSGALEWREGRRSLAAMLIGAMELNEPHDRRSNDAAELVRNRAGNARASSGTIARRIPNN